MVELNKIYNCDCLELMNKLENECIDITITSPPYYNIKKYDNFNLWNNYTDYLNSNKNWFEQLFRITKKGGYVFWNIIENISNVTKVGRCDLPLIADIIKIATECGFIFENQIIWQKHNGSQMFGSYPYPTTPIFKHKKESILVFRKLGKRIVDEKEKKDCQLSKSRWFEIVEYIWNITTESAKRVGHPAPFPIEIPKRFIEIGTVYSSVVFDPFCGSGTTACACKELNRNFITCDTSKQYCELAQNRINNVK